MDRSRRPAPATAVTNAARLSSYIMGLLLLGGYCQPGSAEISNNGYYYGAQFAQFNVELEDVPDLEPTALVLRFGTMLDENLGVEVRLGGGISDDDTDFDILGFDTNVELDIDTFVGIYGIARTRLSDSASVYGLLGITSVSVETMVDSAIISGSGSEDDSGLSFGVGVDYGYSDKYRFTLEYMSYLDADFSASAVSLGVQF